MRNDLLWVICLFPLAFHSANMFCKHVLQGTLTSSPRPLRDVYFEIPSSTTVISISLNSESFTIAS